MDVNQGRIFGFLFITGLVLSLLSPPMAEAQKKSLNRTEDYILFTGADAPGLIGSETADLHLYACRPDGFRAVPFQVDKRDSEARFVFPDEKLRDPMRDGTRLDENDEMVFMVIDSGDRCPKTAWVEGAERGIELELIDPLDRGRAWVYLFYLPGVGPAETRDYVSYRTDEVREYIRTDQYEVGQPLTKTYYDWLKLKRPDASFSPDIFDRQKIGLEARLLNGAIPFKVPEGLTKCKVFGVIDGPVRVIRYEFDYVQALGSMFENDFFLIYLNNVTYNPIEINIPFTMHKIFLEVSIYWAIDFNDHIKGSTFRNAANPKGVILDGEPDADIDDESEVLWMVVTGPQGSLVDVVVKEPRLAEQLMSQTLVVEDPEDKDPHEEHPGKLVAGWQSKSAKKIEKGVYNYCLYHFFPWPFSDEKVQEIFDMIERPVEITVNPLNKP